ncbi:putative aspartic peptidase domain-containing protein [Lupinus albus]|uniref:Putative aspartic peptidase domain-containing protein n=1 Tax=Lupinus albus TaxID=3870 RepID=A0A6A4MT62_LUPAL|nr:putative aspartic peptidase domain-containing protein [Lupinus albus]
MVDFGASHNFLASGIVEEMKIPVEGTHGYFVEVSNGQCLGSQGVCRNVELQLPTLKVIQDFYLFDLVGVDVILGFE